MPKHLRVKVHRTCRVYTSQCLTIKEVAVTGRVKFKSCNLPVFDQIISYHPTNTVAGRVYSGKGGAECLLLDETVE